MENRSGLLTAPADVPQSLDQNSLFGPPPLSKGEDVAAYDKLLADVSGAVKPGDFFERIWVRDIVDLTWETLRMRRIRADLLTSETQAVLENVLEEKLELRQAGKLSARWAAGDPQTIERINKRLASIGTNMENLTAGAWAGIIDINERIDRMVMNAEVRRNAALREIERHRTSIAHALRRASDDILDAEFADVAPNQDTKNVA